MSFAIYPSHPCASNNQQLIQELSENLTVDTQVDTKVDTKVDTQVETVEGKTATQSANIVPKSSFGPTSNALVMHPTGEIEDYH